MSYFKLIIDLKIRSKLYTVIIIIQNFKIFFSYSQCIFIFFKVKTKNPLPVTLIMF